MHRKVVAVWVSLLIMVSSIVILVEIAERVEAPSTLYVGGAGGGNYSKIQWAINDASDGDTVFVYNGTYYEHVTVNKTITLVGENRDNTIINGSGNGRGIFITNTNNAIIMEFKVENCGSNYGDGGITVEKSQYLLITNNNVSQNNFIGILIYNSSYINVSNNYISENIRGIMINGYFGLCTHNTIFNNTIVDNLESSHLNDNGILLYYRVDDTTIESNYIRNNNLGCEINVINPGQTGWRIENNILVNNDEYGIYTQNMDDCVIINNIISNGSGIGIRFLSSEYNDIMNNNITDYDYGIYLTSSPNNRIYFNNFIDNAIQAYDNNNNLWNNIYPLGGNYWSDYGGVDNFKGLNQDIPGNDGLGDTNYSIDSDSIDYYPLMGPYKPLENYIILKQGWNLVSIPLIQDEQNMTRVLGTIDSWYDAVQCYDITGANDHWKHHKIGKPFGNDLTHLNETMSFWIHITNPGDTIFLYNGTQPTSNQTIQLHPGWNMVGYPSLSNHNRTAGLNNLVFGTDVDAIQWFDAATQTWHFMGPDDVFSPGRGYWVHSKVEAGWEVPL